MHQADKVVKIIIIDKILLTDEKAALVPNKKFANNISQIVNEIKIFINKGIIIHQFFTFFKIHKIFNNIPSFRTIVSGCTSQSLRKY